MTKIRPIRLDDQEWEDMLDMAIKAGYANRAEYIRSMCEPAKVHKAAPEPPKPVQVIAPIQAAPTFELARMTLSQVSAKWTKNKQEEWLVSGYARAKNWCQLVLDTIYDEMAQVAQQ